MYADVSVTFIYIHLLASKPNLSGTVQFQDWNTSVVHLDELWTLQRMFEQLANDTEVTELENSKMVSEINKKPCASRSLATLFGPETGYCITGNIHRANFVKQQSIKNEDQIIAASKQRWLMVQTSLARGSRVAHMRLGMDSMQQA